MYQKIVNFILNAFSCYKQKNKNLTIANRSLKSLGAVSCSPSVVTMAVSVAVCDIFSVKEWPDLEIRVRVHSRSMEMAPIDRSHTSLNT